MRGPKPLQFRTLNGCFICVSHKTNTDGYLRLKAGPVLRMFHRTVLEMRGIPIPKGHEVDHLCNNRGCSNPAHLEVMPRKAHLTKTNRDRYEFTRLAAKDYWLETGCTGTALGERYGQSSSTGCRWIRGFQTH